MIESLIFDAILFIYKVLISVSAGRPKQEIILLLEIPNLFQSALASIAFLVYLEVMLLMLLWLFLMLSFGF